MKILRKFLLGFIILVVLILSLAILVSRMRLKKPLPDYNADIQLSGLSAKVDVFRDMVGTPQIYAENESDLYRAVGYIMAQDRMWQMDLLRRVTQGRLSEIFGSDFLDADLLMRSLRFTEHSRQRLEKSPEYLVQALESFSDGVNQYIENRKENYPIEFSILDYTPEPWEPEHAMNLIGYMAWDLKSGWRQLIYEEIKGVVDSAHFVELLPDFSLQKSFVFDSLNAMSAFRGNDLQGSRILNIESFKDSTHQNLRSFKNELLRNNKLLCLKQLDELCLDVMHGSNNWAVSAEKSTTGKPILANDMHLRLGVPSIWMQMHQHVPGKVHVSGLVLPGIPFVMAGHNEHIAWGMTHAYIDNLDYYEERINPDDSNQYWYNGQWNDFVVVDEKILSTDGTLHDCQYRYNHRGPVVSDYNKVEDRELTIRWTGHEESNEVLSAYRVNRATNWEEFKTAFRTFRALGLNVAYADDENNIGMYCCAGVPIRKRSKMYSILPGWSDEFDWKGLVAFDSLPYEYNPPRGFIASANNRIADERFPYHLGTWYDLPYRIDRIHEMLTETEELSPEDFKNMQNDQHSKFAELTLDVCLPLIDTSGFNNTEAEVWTYLRKWNGDMDRDRIAPAVFETFVYHLMEQIYQDELGAELFEKVKGISSVFKTGLYYLLHNQKSVWIDNINTPEKDEKLAEIVNQSYRKTVRYLQQELRTDVQRWNWGSMHALTIKHPLSKVEALDYVFKLSTGPHEVGGSNHTVSPFSYPYFSPEEGNHGASHRHIFSVDDWDQTKSVLPTGNSGQPGSEFYTDQATLYIQGKYHVDLFTKEKVIENSVYHMKFTPTGILGEKDN